MTGDVVEPYADYVGYEVSAEPVRLHLDVVAGVDGVSVRWEALGAAPGAGMVAGQPGEVARAVGALVLRLAGAGEGMVAVADEEPTRRLVRGG